MNDNSLCPVCGNPRSDNKSGSLTQWIIACDCENKTLNEAAQTMTGTICSRCGKKIKGEQAGSITQFIFGFAFCSCEMEERLNVSIPNMIPEEEECTPEDLQSEPELECSPMMFPLERYKPLSILWENFAGTLYLARDRVLNTRVTIRVSRQLDAQQLVEFQKWSQNLSKINHDSIVRVLNFGVTETMVPYLVCSQPEGVLLSALLEQKQTLSWHDSSAILSSLCDGLRAAHQQSVYYRIIRTEDIIVSVRGGEVHGVLLAPSVLDEPKRSPMEAGSAAAYLDETGYKLDSFIGSQPSEVYSMACILFEMLSGRRPFNKAVVGCNELDDPPAAFDVPENSPLKGSPELERLRVLFKKTLSGKRSERIRTVEDFQSALEELDLPLYQPDGNEASVKQKGDTTFATMVALLVALVASMAWGAYLITESGGEIDRTIAGKNTAGGAKGNSVGSENSAPRSNRGASNGNSGASKTNDAAEIGDSKDEPTLAGVMSTFQNQKWTRVGNIYSGAPSNTDADFALLNNVPDATDIGVQSSDSVTGEGLAAINKKQPQRLNLQSASLNDGGLKAISSFENLEWLALGVFDKVTPAGFEQLRRLPKLRSFSISRAKLPDNVFDVVTKMPELHGFEIISSENFRHADLTRLSQFEKLEHLGLCSQNITDEDCEVISKTKLNHIRFFELTNNEITDKGVESLSHVNVYDLDISGNKITDKSLQSLATTKSLVKLIITGCPQVTSKARMIFRARRPRCQLIDLDI
jgi:Serine/threonine protein kinase